MDSRDYYADLELPVSADVNDIKKQFRKLGTESRLIKWEGRANYLGSSKVSS